jgi:prophage tail gpP-like protein
MIGAQASDPDELALIIGGKQWAGWQRVTVARSMESVPASFDLQVTEHYPTSPDVSIKPGDPCKVMIGGELVITGFIDRYGSSLSPGDHTVRISGRSKSADLVDCSAFVGQLPKPTFGVKSGTTLSIAQALAKPYGVTITSLAGPGVTIPQFQINLGETVWEIIDRITRFSQLIAYDMPDGSVVLARSSTEKMSSGFVQGVNLERAEVTFTMDERFSDYIGHFTSTAAYHDDAGPNAPDIGEVIHDGGVPRFRLRIILSEQTQDGRPIATDRARWECNRRIGRSQAVTVTCDSWRDSAGKLWAPNHMAPISVPALKLPEASWTIGHVVYTRDEWGQHAIVTLMPAEAFLPEPVGTPYQLPPTVDQIEQNNAARREPPT